MVIEMSERSFIPLCHLGHKSFHARSEFRR
ncbi:hypothetical protein BKA12_001899 [Neomicrococcus lactis]|uniref:Uncharacterized protein n=1 Tax=Neomicrococcus lactis TaxID=732241 RepID=A0A7W9DBS7_9MICC|nr:hypothetical protein [Neomicrococcus lactis]